MSLAVIIPDRNIDNLLASLTSEQPDIDIQIWPNIPRPQDVTLALVWNPPAGALASFSNLFGILSYGAGVDSILAYQNLPCVAISRIVDQHLAQKMSRYLVAHITHIEQRISEYQGKQSRNEWGPKGALKANRIGLLGVGQLGSYVGRTFQSLDYEVRGWRRQQKQHEAIECEYGLQGLYALANWADYLICLLPLTKATRGIVNKAVFDAMPAHGVIINVGRGAHVNEADLREALDNSQIKHAVLDVFQTEPLPAEHWCWQHKKVTITPHVSALTSMKAITQQVLTNYRLSQLRKPLVNQIDINQGY